MADSTNTVEEPDRTHLIVALDLLSGLTQALGTEIQPFFAGARPSIIDLMVACFGVRSRRCVQRLAKLTGFTQYPEPPVKQSAFALLGDTAISCFPLLQPKLSAVMPEVIGAISVDVKSDFISVCNNAAWCAGEISLKHQAAMEPYVQPLMERLVPLLLNARVARSLTENAAVTIGRLALVCPQHVAPALKVFVKHWCEALAEIKDNDEKDSAFRGICMAIQSNPGGVAEVTTAVDQAETSADNNSTGLWCILKCTRPVENPFTRAIEYVQLRQWKNSVVQKRLSLILSLQILHGFKSMSGEERWNAQMAQLPPMIGTRLREIYGV